MSFQTEAELQMQLRKEFQAQGYRVEAGACVTAPDGSRAQPDLVARKHSHTVLIAFRPYGSSARDEERIRTLSDAADAQEDCSFRLFFVAGPETALPEPPGLAEIAGQLGRARALRGDGDSANALLAAWSALEAATRSALGTDTRPPRLQAATALVKDLIAHGFLGQDQLTRFHDLARTRDLVAHGFFHMAPGDKDLEAVIGLADTVLGNRPAPLRIAAVSRSGVSGQKAPRSQPG